MDSTDPQAKTSRRADARTPSCRELLKAADWSRTELGPMERWPRTLRGYVSMVMEMPTPAILFWGPEQIQLYNDGYAVIMGPRHPRYFGATYRECWPDTYPVIHPWMKRVLADGEVTQVERALFMLTRHGFNEEAYFTFTFSPLRDDSGALHAQRRHRLQQPGVVAGVAHDADGRVGRQGTLGRRPGPQEAPAQRQLIGPVPRVVGEQPGRTRLRLFDRERVVQEVEGLRGDRTRVPFAIDRTRVGEVERVEDVRQRVAEHRQVDAANVRHALGDRVVVVIGTGVGRIKCPAAVGDELTANGQQCVADDLGVEPAPDSPRAFADYIRSETGKWARVIKAANIKLE